MTKFTFLPLILAIGFGLVGCEKSANSGSPTPQSTLKSISSDESGSNNSATAGNETKKSEVVKIDLAKLPADLKGDAFEYYGLGRTEPIKMTVVRGSDKSPASQNVSLTKVESDAAEFTIISDGALKDLGEVKVKLDKSGIRVVSLKGEAADPDTFELPNGLTKGKSWPFKLPSSDAKISGVNKVIGTESVKTAVRTYADALVVETTATGTQSGQKIQLKSKQWLVKGRGQVKAEITNVSGKTTTKISMEESE